MPFLKRSLSLALVLLCAARGAAAEDLAQNRRDLTRWRQMPEALARLRQDALAFLALPPERRKQLIKLDEELRRQDPATQARLLDALDRYAAWLRRLPEKDRRYVEEAADKKQRLRRIREVKERRWLEALPKAQRDDLNKLKDPDRAARIAQLRQQQRQARQDWRTARYYWDPLVAAPNRAHPDRPTPTGLADLADSDHVFVMEYLKPTLSAEEWQKLEKAQGQWPRFPRVLVELADRHPLALPGPHGPSRFEDLPADLRKHMQVNGEPAPPFKKLPKQWPAFAHQLVESLNKRPKGRPRFPNELWASREIDLSVPVRDFLKERLLKVLSREEAERLAKAEGAWPAYPRTIQELAAAHHLTVPWQTLPGKRERWHGYRLHRPPEPDGLPPVAHKELRDFEELYLGPAEREKLQLSAEDPSRWARLTRAYFEQRPAELERLRELDRVQRRPGGK
jgi:hypothetical protein